MSRPKKGEDGYEEANNKWRRTIKEKYGGVTEFMRSIGAKGGLLGRSGGFASKKVGKDGLTGKERASIAGQKGGRLSKRRKKKTDDCE